MLIKRLNHKLAKLFTNGCNYQSNISLLPLEPTNPGTASSWMRRPWPFATVCWFNYFLLIQFTWEGNCFFLLEYYPGKKYCNILMVKHWIHVTLRILKVHVKITKWTEMACQRLKCAIKIYILLLLNNDFFIYIFMLYVRTTKAVG